MGRVPEVRLVVEDVHVDAPRAPFAVLLAQRFNPPLDDFGGRFDAGQRGRPGLERLAVDAVAVARFGTIRDRAPAAVRTSTPGNPTDVPSLATQPIIGTRKASCPFVLAHVVDPFPDAPLRLRVLEVPVAGRVPGAELPVEPGHRVAADTMRRLSARPHALRDPVDEGADSASCALSQPMVSLPGRTGRWRAGASASAGLARTILSRSTQSAPDLTPRLDDDAIEGRARSD